MRPQRSELFFFTSSTSSVSNSFISKYQCKHLATAEMMISLCMTSPLRHELALIFGPLVLNYYFSFLLLFYNLLYFSFLFFTLFFFC